MSKWAHRLQRLSFQTVGVLSMSIQTNQYQSSIFREDFRKVKRKFHVPKVLSRKKDLLTKFQMVFEQMSPLIR